MSTDPSVPHPARRYNYWLGGKDHFQADRDSGDAIAELFPTVRAAALFRRVADALGDFATNWSHAKEALRTELDELAAGADGAAAAYAAAEERIAAGMSREQP